MNRTKPKKKRIADFPKPYRDALAYWSTLRKLGFEAEEIFFGFGEVSGQQDILCLQLKTQGKTFTAMVEQMPGADRWQVFNTWGKITKAMHTSTQPERAACVKEHLLGNREYFGTLVQAIQAKGIVVPELAHLTPHAGTS